MSTTSQLSQSLRAAFDHPTRGVVGIVDDLLRICQQHALELDWQVDRCRVQSLVDGSEEVLDRPLRKSVFRAVLARVAAVCNEQHPGSVSPYGGDADLLLGASPTLNFH